MSRRSRPVRRRLPALILASLVALPSVAQTPSFYNLVEGTPLDFSDLEYEEETDAVKAFKRSGRNPYNEDQTAIRNGESLFATACSGCHGHHGEGKLGPGLTDDYWTYPANNTDSGLFSSIYDGLTGQMGPQKNRLTQDEMLQVMAWVRSRYTGDPANAGWKSPAPRNASFTTRSLPPTQRSPA
ncbi:cytochrome c(L), periplasmic [Rubrivivax gelatinosus]|nr:cytochrome c(L), periplasmic [Rubrivivax gelatinosus]